MTGKLTKLLALALFTTLLFATPVFADELSSETNQKALQFLQTKFSSLQARTLSDLTSLYDHTHLDVDRDGKAELILSSYQMGMPMAVLKPQGSTFTMLYSINNDTTGLRTTKISMDKYKNLYVYLAHTGTGLCNEKLLIAMWDGKKLRTVWTGVARHYNYSGLEDTEWFDGTGYVTLTDKGKKLNYKYVYKEGYSGDLYGIYDKKTKGYTLTREYKFDNKKFTFVKGKTTTKKDPAVMWGKSISETRLGPIKLFDSEKVVKSKLGKPLKVVNDEYSIALHYKGLVVYLDTYAKDVCAVDLKAGSHKTARGIKIGDSLAKVKKTYGDPDITESGYYQYNSTQVDWFVYAVRVYIKAGKVSAISVFYNYL